MRRGIFLSGLALLYSSLYAASFPLETIIVQGTRLPDSTVVRVGGLRLGAPADQAVFDQAAAKLSGSGLFSSVEYKFAPGNRGGYVLTLSLTDWKVLLPAAIDVPGVDEESVWKWLASSFPPYIRRVPDSGAALEFLAREIETHLATRLGGGRVTTVLETKAGGGGDLISFQPVDLPRVAAVSFEGNSEIASPEMDSALRKLMGDSGYLERRFRDLVELNLRRLYEERGMYRVRFSSITAERSGSNSVAVKVVVEEGPKFTLGNVHMEGLDLPSGAIMKEGGFRLGQTANWTEIQQGIYRTERPLRRLGFLDVAVKPERRLDDNALVLDVVLHFVKGPLYRLGRIRFDGLPDGVEAKAHRVWRLREGEPFNPYYPDEFLAALSATEDLRAFKGMSPDLQRRPGEALVDLTLKFVPR